MTCEFFSQCCESPHVYLNYQFVLSIHHMYSGKAINYCAFLYVVVMYHSL